MDLIGFEELKQRIWTESIYFYIKIKKWE